MSYTENPLSGKQALLLRTLIEGPKTSQQIWATLYADDPDGGPITNTVQSHIHHLKDKLLPGWTIEHVPGTYRLVRK